MRPSDTPPQSSGRRRVLVAFVNSVAGLIGGGLAALAGAFALRPASAAGARWLRAGSTDDLAPDVPTPRVLTFPRADGWYRERARATVFLVWDGGDAVRALSATCTHLGCQVQWVGDDRKFRCPCHGGVFDAAGRVESGPPPRGLDELEARLDPASGTILVRL